MKKAITPMQIFLGGACKIGYFIDMQRFFINIQIFVIVKNRAVFQVNLENGFVLVSDSTGNIENRIDV